MPAARAARRAGDHAAPTRTRAPPADGPHRSGPRRRRGRAGAGLEARGAVREGASQGLVAPAVGALARSASAVARRPPKFSFGASATAARVSRGRDVRRTSARRRARPPSVYGKLARPRWSTYKLERQGDRLQEEEELAASERRVKSRRRGAAEVGAASAATAAPLGSLATRRGAALEPSPAPRRRGDACAARGSRNLLCKRKNACRRARARRRLGKRVPRGTCARARGGQRMTRVQYCPSRGRVLEPSASRRRRAACARVSAGGAA